jgi:hypothetical protein
MRNTLPDTRAGCVKYRSSMWRTCLWGAALTCVIGTCVIGTTGCGAKGEERLIPSKDAARRAVEVALSAWQNGKLPPGCAQERAPAIHLIDTHIRTGQKLTKFILLGPAIGDVQRCFAVRLMLDNPCEEVRARYVVFGIDPLWVFRYEDFAMLSHWECPPGNPSPSKEELPHSSSAGAGH